MGSYIYPVAISIVSLNNDLTQIDAHAVEQAFFFFNLATQCMDRVLNADGTMSRGDRTLKARNHGVSCMLYQRATRIPDSVSHKIDAGGKLPLRPDLVSLGQAAVFANISMHNSCELDRWFVGRQRYFAIRRESVRLYRRGIARRRWSATQPPSNVSSNQQKAQARQYNAQIDIGDPQMQRVGRQMQSLKQMGQPMVRRRPGAGENRPRHHPVRYIFMHLVPDARQKLPHDISFALSSAPRLS